MKEEMSKDEIKEYFKHRYHEMQEREELQKELIMGNYINWLYDFLKRMHSFRDYEANNFFEKDGQNIAIIYFLYEGIKKYAQKNNIMPMEHGNVLYYMLKYQDLFFSIGEIDYGTSIVYGCGIEEENDYYINFEDVRKDLTKEKTKTKTITSE